MLSVAQAATAGTAAGVQQREMPSPLPQEEQLLHSEQTNARSALTVHAADGAQVPAVARQPRGEHIGASTLNRGQVCSTKQHSACPHRRERPFIEGVDT